jgi:hypothetical protein
LCRGQTSGRFNRAFTRCTTFASFLWSSYFAQPSKAKFSSALLSGGLPVRAERGISFPFAHCPGELGMADIGAPVGKTAIGPESRIHPRSVGMRKKVIASSHAPAFFSISFARLSAARPSTIRKTRSTRVRWRTISANAHGIGANFPGQSVSSCGQPSHVASCDSHSAGIRKCISVGGGMWSAGACSRFCFAGACPGGLARMTLQHSLAGGSRLGQPRIESHGLPQPSANLTIAARPSKLGRQTAAASRRTPHDTVGDHFPSQRLRIGS